MKEQEKVYWTDPDNGICSGEARFIKHKGDTAVIKKDGVFIEVYPEELKTIQELEVAVC